MPVKITFKKLILQLFGFEANISNGIEKYDITFHEEIGKNKQYFC